MEASRPYRGSFLLGFLWGGLLFLSPMLFGKFGVVGADYFFKRFPATGDNVILLAIPYLIISTLIFIVYAFTHLFRRHKFIDRIYLISYLIFLAGLVLSFLIFFVLAMLAISRGSFLFF
jgi:hypothetical protein